MQLFLELKYLRWELCVLVEELELLFSYLLLCSLLCILRVQQVTFGKSPSTFVHLYLSSFCWFLFHALHWVRSCTILYVKNDFFGVARFQLFYTSHAKNDQWFFSYFFKIILQYVMRKYMEFGILALWGV